VICGCYNPRVARRSKEYTNVWKRYDKKDERLLGAGEKEPARDGEHVYPASDKGEIETHHKWVLLVDDEVATSEEKGRKSA